MGKDKGEGPEGPEPLDAEGLFDLFHSTYKASCSERGMTPLALIAQDIDTPEKLNWVVLNRPSVRVRPQALQALVAAIKVLEPNVLSVRHFTLWTVGLGDEAALACVPLLDNQHKLQVFDLFEERISSVGLTALAPALSLNEHLKELQLSYNSFGDEGMSVLAGALSENHTLESLQVAFCGLTQAGASVLSEAVIANKDCVLQKLCLRGNEQIGFQGARVILEAVKESETMTELDLSETFKLNHIMNNPSATEPGLRSSLRDALAGHPTLATIDLRGNHIDNEDAAMLLALAQTNKSLTDIAVDRDLGTLYEELAEVMASNQAAAGKGKKAKKKKK
eukprot:TRINITY_DN33504_c0_g2_i1.p1 TRINITY_DN33504_c0_g2~~TRINITY_DN33504_c0_g2_i1.p1  ORF type:complete len:336 (+),score=72.61 TRINITY_DN33504_c0_g2_i1:149-1156(+)